MMEIEHTRSTKSEAWRIISRTILVVCTLSIFIIFLDLHIAIKSIALLILTGVAVLSLFHAIGNFQNTGNFICRLTADDFIQITPFASCGDSFHVQLLEITQIEIHESGGEPAFEYWYIHTQNGRHKININYGNPYQKFGKALQKALPEIQTIRTNHNPD
jgi:hypothetical protein